uniref:Uncharacterized protein n=1 Tax=Anopheles epiroticus TaxID=199890 RepID=A0A182P123_9DIPT
MKLFGSSSALLLVLIVGLVWSEQLEQDNDTNDLETAESAFHIDPKTVIFTGLAGIGALVVKGIALGIGGGKLLLLAKHAGNSHSSSDWDSSSSKSYSSHPSYPMYKSYSSSYSSGESKSTAYTGSLKVSGSLTPVSSVSSTSDSPSSSTESAPSKTGLSLDDVDDPLPEN